jgi:hypothetical protein
MNDTCGINKVDEWNALPPKQSSVDFSQFVEVPCVTSLPREDQASLEFRLDKSDTAIDLGSMLMHIQLQVLKADAKHLGEKDKVGGTNLLAYSLFESVETYISDQRVSQSTSQYPWMCYVLNLLYQSRDFKKTILRSALWYPDDAYLFDVMEVGGEAINNGWKDRSAIAQKSNQIDLMSKVMLDFSIAARVLPVQTELALRFNRSSPSFCLMSQNGEFKIRINAARLYVMEMNLTPQALQRHAQMLEDGGVDFPANKYSTRTISMMKGAQNLDWVPFNGVMPQKIYIWQLSQEAFNGKIDKNPFNFQQFDLSKVQVLVNERSMITSQPISLKSENVLYMNTTMNIPEFPLYAWEFYGDYCVIVVDLTRDHSAGCNYWSEPVNGNLRVLMDYKEPLKESIVVFCMGEFNSILHLDHNRNPSWTL